MGFFRKRTSNDLVPIHPDNIGNKDWLILLEVGTVIGPSPQRIRVAGWMQEKKIVKKYDMFLRTNYFIVIEGYNPRIHAVYFCPQLFPPRLGQAGAVGRGGNRPIDRARGRGSRRRASSLV